ncbi:tetratricopeptide repeat protein [Deminuibacter soli]|nr:tetratricopeptide repeat protein [Deminuibacter soli]
MQANAQPALNESINKATAISTRQPDTAFLLLRNVYTTALEKKQPREAGIAMQQMGNICYTQGHYGQSLDCHLKAADLFKAAGAPDLVAANLNDIGNLYYYNKQMMLARAHFDQALDIFQRSRNYAGIAATLGAIGHLYEKKQQYDSAFYFQYAALQQFVGKESNTGMAAILENAGSIHEDLGRYDSAYYYYSKAKTLYEQENNISGIIDILNNLGDILRKTGRYEAAMEKTRESVYLSERTNDQYQLSAAYKDLAQEWHLLQRDDSAYYYQDLSRKAILNIYSKENNKQVAFLQVLNQVGKKDSEIESLKIKHRNTIVLTIASIVLGALLICICMLVISRQRLKIKTERLLNEQQQEKHDAESALMEIALKNQQLQENVLRQDLDQRAKELSTHTLHIIRKNHFLEDLRNRLDTLVKDDKRDQKKQLQQLMQQIDLNFNQDQHWDEFSHIFEQVHESFFEKVRLHCDELTSNDLRLIALLKMNVNSNDIATLLGISPDSLRVTRYRLRKKLNLQQGENLSAFLQSL